MITNADYLLSVLIYVAFCRSRSNSATVYNVLKVIQAKIIDVKQMLMSSTDRSQQLQ